MLLSLQIGKVCVVDATKMTKISNGKFYYDRKKMITVSYIPLNLSLNILYSIYITADSFTVWLGYWCLSSIRKSLDSLGECLPFHIHSFITGHQAQSFFNNIYWSKRRKCYICRSVVKKLDVCMWFLRHIKCLLFCSTVLSETCNMYLERGAIQWNGMW